MISGQDWQGEPARAFTGTLSVGTLTSARSGPTVLRIALGTQLRRLREASNLTTAQAAEAIRATHSKISRLERGRSAARPRDVADLLSSSSSPTPPSCGPYWTRRRCAGPRTARP